LPIRTDESAQRMRPRDLAPGWHTAALIFVMVAVVVIGALGGGQGAPAPIGNGSRIIAIYLPILLVQAGLTVYVTRIGRPQNAIVTLLGRRWDTPRRALADLGFAILVGAFIVGSELAWGRLQGASKNTSLMALLPETDSERLAWVLVAISVGFAEEVVYRGYLQRQLAAFTKSETLATVLQAVLFGLAHGNQGWTTAARFAVYGIVLAVLARARGSLLSGIACHAGIDIAAGLLGR